MDISASLDRILRHSDTLADLFYLVFLQEFPHVQQHFHGVDMKRQNVLLTLALMAVERHYRHRYAATAAYLHMLGEQHRQRGIGLELYPLWRQALLATLERFHAQEWNEALAAEWRSALDLAIAAMSTAYAG